MGKSDDFRVIHAREVLERCEGDYQNLKEQIQKASDQMLLRAKELWQFGGSYKPIMLRDRNCEPYTLEDPEPVKTFLGFLEILEESGLYLPRSVSACK